MTTEVECLVGPALVAKLRAYVSADGDWQRGLMPADVLAAADEIERLRRFMERAEGACADPSRPRQHVGEILAAGLWPNAD